MKLLKLLMVGASLFYAAAGIAADAKIKTYVLAEKTKGDVATVAEATKAKLTKAGFEVVGTYSPYSTATILIVTNAELKANAKNSETGAYGAAQRVTITKAEGEIQVAFTNPTYMAHIYRMKGDLKSVTAKLKSVLGDKGEYGPEEGLTPEELRDYHYKWLMPYFTDPLELADHGNQQVALTKVEAALANNKTGVKKIYRIDMDGKEETVIGVSMSGPDELDCSGDKYIE